MLIRKPDDIPSSEITDEKVYLNRRQWIAAAGAVALSGVPALAACQDGDADQPADKLNTWEQITSYNNFYEFGTDKEEPARLAPRTLRTRPWTVVMDGLCRKPARYNFEDLIRPHRIQDRTYRLRCVEAWSMVVPWMCQLLMSWPRARERADGPESSQSSRTCRPSLSTRTFWD